MVFFFISEVKSVLSFQRKCCKLLFFSSRRWQLSNAFFAYICSTHVWTLFQYLTSRDQVQVRTAGKACTFAVLYEHVCSHRHPLKNPNAPQWLIVTVAMSWGEYGEDSHHQLGAQILCPPTLWPYCTVFPLGRIRSAITSMGGRVLISSGILFTALRGQAFTEPRIVHPYRRKPEIGWRNLIYSHLEIFIKRNFIVRFSLLVWIQTLDHDMAYYTKSEIAVSLDEL